MVPANNADPLATTVVGSISYFKGISNDFSKFSRITGLRVEPPTRIM